MEILLVTCLDIMEAPALLLLVRRVKGFEFLLKTRKNHREVFSLSFIVEFWESSPGGKVEDRLEENQTRGRKTNFGGKDNRESCGQRQWEWKGRWEIIL